MWFWWSVALAFPPIPDPPTNPTFGQGDLVRFEMLDLDGSHAAVKVVLRDSRSEGAPKPCGYAGMGDPHDGVTLYLVTLATAEARAFDVYPIEPCLSHERSAAVLAEAKAAFASAGLDPARMPQPIEANNGRFSIPTPSGRVDVRLEQDKHPYAIYAGEHEITSTLLCGEALLWRSIRTYTAQGVGSGEATFPLAYQTEKGVVFVEQWSIGNMGGSFDSFSLSVPLRVAPYTPPRPRR